MRRRILAAVTIAPLGLLALPAARADAAPEPRPLVTVLGTAELQVVPDLVDLRVGIETRDRDLGYAFRTQEERVRQILDVARKYGVEDKDVQTAHVAIAPVYDEDKSGRRLSYYQLQKSIGITLRDPSRYDPMIADLLTAGVNTIDEVSFRSSTEQTYRDQARAKAVESAREKASAMAAKLGQQIGKAFTIEEVLEPGYANAVLPAPPPVPGEGYASASIEPTLALGQIVIRATVRVAFELR